jgi:uncharacterized coiled-coil protein SlyX
MRRLGLAGVAVALALPAQAAAGGWWSYPQLAPSTAAPGQRVTVRAEVLFPTRTDARRAQHVRYLAYALRGLDGRIVQDAMRRAKSGDWWSPEGAELVELGPVAVDAVDGNLAVARGAFRLPELAPGRYAVMLCTAGCASPLADVVPAERYQIVADPATARLAERVRRLEERLVRQAGALLETRAALAEVRKEARGSAAVLEQLEARLAAAGRRPTGHVSVPWLFLSGWALAAVLLVALGLLVALRRRPASPAWPSDAELAELIASERARAVSGRRP